MGTDFDNFDASELGDFLQSELGDRNDPDRPGPHVGILFAGSNTIFNSWLDDLYAPVQTRTVQHADWESFLDDYELVFYDATFLDISDPTAAGGENVARSVLAFLRTMPKLRRVVMLERGGFRFVSPFIHQFYLTLTGLNLIGVLQSAASPQPLLPHVLTAGQTQYTFQTTTLSLQAFTGGTALCRYPLTHPSFPGATLLGVNRSEFEFVVGIYSGLLPDNAKLVRNLWSV